YGAEDDCRVVVVLGRVRRDGADVLTVERIHHVEVPAELLVEKMAVEPYAGAVAETEYSVDQSAVHQREARIVLKLRLGAGELVRTGLELEFIGKPVGRVRI